MQKITTPDSHGSTSPTHLGNKSKICLTRNTVSDWQGSGGEGGGQLPACGQLHIQQRLICILGISSLFFKCIYRVYRCVRVYRHVRGFALARVASSFHSVGPGSQIQFARFDGTHLCAPSHRASCLIFLEHLLCAKHLEHSVTENKPSVACGWWCAPVTSSLGNPKQKDCSEFQVKHELQRKILLRYK